MIQLRDKPWGWLDLARCWVLWPAEWHPLHCHPPNRTASVGRRTHRQKHCKRPSQISLIKALNLYCNSRIFVAQSTLHFIPGRPVQVNTISTFTEASSHAAISAQKLLVLTISSLESHHCLLSGTHLYSWVNQGKVGWTKLPKFWNSMTRSSELTIWHSKHRVAVPHVKQKKIQHINKNCSLSYFTSEDTFQWIAPVLSVICWCLKYY